MRVTSYSNSRPHLVSLPHLLRGPHLAFLKKKKATLEISMSRKKKESGSQDLNEQKLRRVLLHKPPSRAKIAPVYRNRG